MAFELGAVFRVGLEAFDVTRIDDPAHHHLQQATHELARPSDLVEREQDAQQDDEQLTHGWEYTRAHGPVSSAGVHPPFLSASGLKSRGV